MDPGEVERRYTIRIEGDLLASNCEIGEARGVCLVQFDVSFVSFRGFRCAAVCVAAQAVPPSPFLFVRFAFSSSFFFMSQSSAITVHQVLYYNCHHSFLSPSPFFHQGRMFLAPNKPQLTSTGHLTFSKKAGNLSYVHCIFQPFRPAILHSVIVTSGLATDYIPTILT